MANESEKLGEVVKRASRKEILEVLESQNYSCALSGVQLTPDCAQLDHIIPESKGGSHCKDNLQVLHKTVNAMKSAMTQEDFLSWCVLIANHSGAPS